MMNRKSEDIYGEWIRRRQSVPVPKGFTERTAAAIAGRHAAGPVVSPLYRVLAGRPVQWAAAVGALLLGLFRLSYITTALLVP